MRSVFEYYLGKCEQAMIHEDILSFEFGNYQIEYTFTINNEVDEDEDEFEDDFFSYNRINDVDEIDRLLEKNIQFISCNIKGYEYLGWREDLESGRSITFEMFSVLKKLKLLNNSIKGFDILISYGESMCHDEGNYLFEINIYENYFGNYEFAHFIANFLNSLKVTIPPFYGAFFRRKVDIQDSKKIPILSTNTKVRRLGYFKILSLFFEEKKTIPAFAINNKFEDYCLDYQKALETNTFNKGVVIKTKSGISAKPYIDTARDLNLLNKINNVFNTGKFFKVYQSLKGEYSKSLNVFELSTFDKLYFLECILKNDYFYFSNLLELFFLENETTYSSLISKYQGQLTERLEDYKKGNYKIKKLEKDFEVILKRINSWEKPTIYLEHLLMPRINWMLDLGIINGSSNKFTISEVGLKLFKHLSIWNDINTSKIISSDGFIDRFMIHLYDDCFNNEEQSNPIETIILEKIYEYIDESFELFKTLAPNRVTASQAVNYTKYKLYLADNIKVGYQYIINKLDAEDQERFIFKFQQQYNDGYIQKK